MVVPWVGFPLRDLVQRFEPTSRAKFVRFETLYRPSEFRGQRARNLRYPYVEGLRMDEALNPLAILSVGIYGKTLLNQNGAPIRLVVPWKYGFKSIKSIVKIEFVEDQPRKHLERRHPARVRVLRERQPGRGSPALVAGRWSGASATSSGSARRSSTGTGTRSPGCTTGWTWRGTTESAAASPVPAPRGPAPGFAAHGHSVLDPPRHAVRLPRLSDPGAAPGLGTRSPGGLGVNPIEDITHRTGDLGAAVPAGDAGRLRRCGGWPAWNGLVRFRRMASVCSPSSTPFCTSRPTWSSTTSSICS